MAERLVGVFLERWKGEVRDVPTALQSGLEELVSRGKQRWPSVALESIAFVRHLGDHAPTDTDPVTAVARVRAEELYLACACANGCPEAVRICDTELVHKLRPHIARLRADPGFTDEALQAVRDRLFVSSQAAPPKIAQYRGQGALDSWIRMVGLRTALNLIASERRHDALDDDHLSTMLQPGDDPELDYIKARYRAAFVAAFKHAFSQLPQRERNMLRFQHLDGLTPERIGGIYGVHRTTAMRWIAAAHKQMLDETRRILMQQLSITASECESLFDLVQSRLDITLRSLLKTTHG